MSRVFDCIYIFIILIHIYIEYGYSYASMLPCSTLLNVNTRIMGKKTILSEEMYVSD